MKRVLLVIIFSFLFSSNYEIEIQLDSYNGIRQGSTTVVYNGENAGKVKRITENDKGTYTIILKIYDTFDINKDMLFKIENRQLVVDLDGMEQRKLRKEEERLAKIKAEALPLFIERINDFDSGRIKFKHVSSRGMGSSNYREFTFRVKYLDFERNVDVPFEGITEKSNRVKFSFDYIECNLDRASKDTKMWKGTKLRLMDMNFVANVDDKWNQWYTVNKKGESNINLIEGREYIVYLRLNDEQLNELNQGIKNGTFKEFSLLHAAGLSRREFYIHSLIN